MDCPLCAQPARDYELRRPQKKSLYEKSPSPRVDVDRGGPEPEGVVDHHGEPAAAAAVGPGGGGGGGLGHVRSGGRLGHARLCRGKVLSERVAILNGIDFLSNREGGILKRARNVSNS